MGGGAVQVIGKLYFCAVVTRAIFGWIATFKQSFKFWTDLRIQLAQRWSTRVFDKSEPLLFCSPPTRLPKWYTHYCILSHFSFQPCEHLWSEATPDRRAFRKGLRPPLNELVSSKFCTHISTYILIIPFEVLIRFSYCQFSLKFGAHLRMTKQYHNWQLLMNLSDTFSFILLSKCRHFQLWSKASTSCASVKETLSWKCVNLSGDEQIWPKSISTTWSWVKYWSTLSFLLAKKAILYQNDTPRIPPLISQSSSPSRLH